MNWKCCKTDGAPKDYQPVFVVARDCPMDPPYIGLAYKEAFHWVDIPGDFELSVVTHWAPIDYPTELPKEEK
jgi:hypothetical protein